MSAFNEPIILLAGGLDRGNEFDELIPSLKNVKAIITFGQTAEKIERVANVAGIKTIQRVDNVGKAVPIAYQAIRARRCYSVITSLCKLGSI